MILAANILSQIILSFAMFMFNGMNHKLLQALYSSLLPSFVLYLVVLLRYFPCLQSRILKHAGDFVAAAALADEARSMDLADRYINSECVKRMLQADQVCVTL